MKKCLIICVSLCFVTACTPSAGGNPTPASASPNASAASAASAAPANPASGSGSVTATKPAYLAFLNCIKARNPDKAEDMAVRISIVESYAEARWNMDYKPLADNQVRTVFSTLGQGCGL